MRTNLLPIALLGLLLLSPLASAQAQQPSLTVDVRASEEPATATAPIVIRGLISMKTDTVSARLAPSGVSVTLEAIEAPAWAIVTFSPSTLVLEFDQPQVSTSATAHGYFEARVHAGDADGADLGILKIAARSSSTQFMSAASSVVSVVVSRATDCHHEEPAGAAAEDDLVLQSAASPTPTGAVAPWGAVAVGTVAAVGVALVVRRKFA